MNKGRLTRSARVVLYRSLRVPCWRLYVVGVPPVWFVAFDVRQMGPARPNPIPCEMSRRTTFQRVGVYRTPMPLPSPRVTPMRTLSRLSIRSALATSALLATFATCSAPAFADDSLYRQFGGKEGIEHVIDDFYDRMLDDPRTKSFFEGASIPQIEKRLNEQFCALMGGPCVYTGRSMKRAHEGLGIDGKAFAAGIDDLKQAMEKNHIPADAQKRLLAKLMAMSHDIQDGR